MSNICMYEEDFDKYVLNMKSWFSERGYSKQMADSQMGNQRLKTGSKQARVDVPFVLTYHPNTSPTNCIAQIMNKLEHLLY